MLSACPAPGAAGASLHSSVGMARLSPPFPSQHTEHFYVSRFRPWGQTTTSITAGLPHSHGSHPQTSSVLPNLAPRRAQPEEPQPKPPRGLQRPSTLQHPAKPPYQPTPTSGPLSLLASSPAPSQGLNPALAQPRLAPTHGWGPTRALSSCTCYPGSPWGQYPTGAIARPEPPWLWLSPCPQLS